MRPTLYGSRHAVSAGHYLASAAAFSILESGGNAIDAGCCAGIALAVLHPDEVNFAGVAPIMIRTGAGKVVTIAGLGYWPKAFPKDLFMLEYNGAQPLGVLRTVVPAAPDAWITALRDFGTMSFGDVAAAAALAVPLRDVAEDLRVRAVEGVQERVERAEHRPPGREARGVGEAD